MTQDIEFTQIILILSRRAQPAESKDGGAADIPSQQGIFRD
jgi:hypothetical protein